jgi:transcription antitermination factor NusG
MVTQDLRHTRDSEINCASVANGRAGSGTACISNSKTRVQDPIMTLNGRAFGTFSDWWFVCQTKPMPGNEKALARDLARIGTAYFLPLEKHGYKSRTVYRPLFPGYVFASGTDGDRYDVKATGRVVQIIDTRGATEQARLREQLQYFYDRLSIGQTFTPPPVSIGCRARIDSNVNPFRGLEGTVARRIAGRDAYEVIVQFFGRETPVEVLGDELERI